MKVSNGNILVYSYIEAGYGFDFHSGERFGLIFLALVKILKLLVKEKLSLIPLFAYLYLDRQGEFEPLCV